MSKSTIKKWAVTLSFMMLCLVVEPVWATTISDLQKQQQELQKQQEAVRRQQEEERKKLEAANQEVSGMEEEADYLSAEIDEIDENLVILMASVDIIVEELAVKEENIIATTAQYEAAKAAEETQYDAMKLRIKFMYERGDSSYLEIFLSSSSFGDMLNKAEYVESLYEYDRNQLEQYQTARAESEALKLQLEEEKAELEAQQHELEEEKAEMERLMAEKKVQFEDYEVKIASARRQAAAYQATIKKQTAQIQQLQKEQEAKKAAEVAAVKAAEEAKKAAEATATGKKGTTGSVNTGGAGGNYAPPGNFGSGGAKIAGYACQFIGNPYVAGGTSLTQGADCSGFVWRVFGDCGYSVPRTSWSCREAGTGVSYSEAQPGDIICYAGHVGIYIGNGYIVHASTQRTGIKITAATYKQILTVRRIV